MQITDNAMDLSHCFIADYTNAIQSGEFFDRILETQLLVELMKDDLKNQEY